MVKPDVDDSKVTVSDDNRIYKGTVIWVNSLAKDITISFDSLTDKGIDDKSDQLDEYVFISDSKSYVNLSAQLSDRPDTVKIITLSDVTPNNGDHLIMYLIKKNSRILLAQMKLVIIHYIY